MENVPFYRMDESAYSGAPGFRNCVSLVNIDLEESVGMFVTPSPIGLLVVLFQFGEFVILPMVLFYVHVVGLILMTVPLMIVVVLFVMIAATSTVILGS
jgi:hypothetical protein